MKIAIGGIKFSEELLHVLYHRAEGCGPTFEAVLGSLAKARINIPFLTIDGGHGDEERLVFCAAAGDAGMVETLLRQLSLVPQQALSAGGGLSPPALVVRHQVGTLTLFPHRRSYVLLGRSIAALAAAGIAVHSYCTSISALAINIDYRLLPRAVEVLHGLVDLPEEHSPFRPDFRIRQLAPERST